MSKPATTLYVVNLHHFSSDGKKAAADLPDAQLNYIPAKQLRGLLEALAALAPTVTYPIEPELRITAPEGKFVVQAKGGKLHFVSWASSHKGGEYSATRIYSIITGEEAQEAARQHTAAAGEGGFRGKAMTVLLVFAIVAVNSFTIWFITRPKKTLLPKYTLLAVEPAERMLGSVAGFYETGGTPGDHRLEIDKTGKVKRYKFGPERTLTTPQTFTVKPADAAGKQALVTSRKSLITIKDSLTVILYGDTYQRVLR